MRNGRNQLYCGADGAVLVFNSKGSSMMFQKISSNEKKILEEIKAHAKSDGYCDDIENYWAEENIIEKRRYLTSLKAQGYVKTDIIGGCELLTKAYTYDEDEAEYERQILLASRQNSLANNREVSMFRKLPSNTKVLLREIVASENPVVMLCERFSKCSHKENDELRSLLRELIDERYINISWADDVPYIVRINNSAHTYDEREAEYERHQIPSASSTTNNFYGDASNIQIQQNASNSMQNMNLLSELDFEKILEIFEQILNNLSTFNLSAEDEKQLENAVNEALPMVQSKTNVSFIKKTMPIIKDILIRTTSSLTASGILYILSQIGV